MSLTLDQGTDPKGISVSVWPHYLLNPPKEPLVGSLNKTLVICIGATEISFLDFCAMNSYVLAMCEVQPEWNQYGIQLRESVRR